MNSFQRLKAVPAIAVTFLIATTTSIADTGISSLPFTASKSGERYFLTSDLGYSGGSPAISITADNVTIDGAGYAIDYCNGGLSSNRCVGVDVGSNSGVVVENLTIKQGGHSFSGGGYGYAIRGSSARNIRITGNTLELKAYPGATGMFGVKVNTTTSGSLFEDNVVKITGAGPMKALDHSESSAWTVQSNDFLITSLKYAKSYARVINVGNGSQYLSNRIVVDSDSEYVNLFVSWGKDDGKILGNVIEYASIHGRPIILDSGSQRWEIADNDMRITSANSGENVVYAIRMRSSERGNGSSYHNIHHNTIDARGSNNVYLIAMGDGTDPNTGNTIAYNKLIGPDRLIDYYHNTVTDTDFYCNSIEHTDSGSYPVYVYGDQHSGSRFDHNQITTQRSDDKLVYFANSQPVTSSWGFCSSINDTGNIAGQGFASTAVSILAAGCGNGFPQCHLDAGAREEFVGSPITRPNAPSNLSASN